ncbi:unnamed protein product [Owenia fusiformis]|uniref:Uncharacterized protein n=1 Tax=Owenia fusiformis TaxID=6347 RepID=A0A8J1Y4C5_OWEFU|nr:unnamed protein product [Owenia fusiformis]
MSLSSFLRVAAIAVFATLMHVEYVHGQATGEKTHPKLAELAQNAGSLKVDLKRVSEKIENKALTSAKEVKEWIDLAKNMLGYMMAKSLRLAFTFPKSSKFANNIWEFRREILKELSTVLANMKRQKSRANMRKFLKKYKKLCQDLEVWINTRTTQKPCPTQVPCPTQESCPTQEPCPTVTSCPTYKPCPTTPRKDAEMDDNFIILVDTFQDSVFQIDANDPNNYRLVTKTGSNPVAIAYDPVDKRIYFTDVDEKTIRSVGLDGSGSEIIKKLGADSVPDGLAIEPNSRLLYYADAGRNSISVMALNGSCERTLVHDNITHPRAIQLDIINKKMYWSDWGLGQIDVANLDGSGRQRISINKDEWPNGLALDVRRQLLYFCDAKTNNIEVIDLKNNNARSVVLKVPESLSARTHFFGITLDETYLYLSDWEKRQLHRITRVGASSYHDNSFGPQHFIRINGLQIYKSSLRIIDASVCQTNNGGCPCLCIPSNSSAGRTCM